MADLSESIPKMTPEQRQRVATSFTHAKKSLASGNLDYAIELLVDCCKRDPANIPFRQELRRTEKLKYKDNKTGKPMAGLSTWWTSLKMGAAAKKQPLKAIELAEEVLRSNPWHLQAHLVSAKCFAAIGLKDLALWTLDQARQAHSMNPEVNRQMAKLFEERGQYTQAMALWKLVAQKLPTDKEAAKKANELAASATIAKGRYDQAATGDAPSPSKAAAVAAPRMDEHGDISAGLAEQRVAKDSAQYLQRIEENPSNPVAYLALAQLYRRNDMGDKAREIIKKGLAAAGNNFDLTLEASDLEIDPMRKDLAACEEKLRENPKDTGLAATRTKLLKEVNNRELAFFRQKSDRYPTDSSARFEMAVRLFKIGQFNEAIQELQKVRTDPKHKTRVLIYLGQSFKSLNNWRLAQRNFEEAMQHLSPAEESFRKELMFQLATGYSENGELPRAIELGCELANMDFSYKNIGGLIDEWQKRGKK